MTVSIKTVPGKKFSEVYFKGEFLTDLYQDKDGTFGVSLADDFSSEIADGFPTKEKAIGKALHYYKGVKRK